MLRRLAYLSAETHGALCAAILIVSTIYWLLGITLPVPVFSIMYSTSVLLVMCTDGFTRDETLGETCELVLISTGFLLKELLLYYFQL